MANNYEISNFIQSAVVKYSKTVTRTAFSYLKNISDAEDITQEVFLILLQSNRDFEDDEHLKAWLIRVTINKCKNHLKSRWFKNRRQLPEDLSYMPDEENEMLQAVLSLSDKYRIPIHLYYYEGYSIKEISEILDEPIATVGTRLARGRSQLKKLIGGDSYGKEVIQISN